MRTLNAERLETYLAHWMRNPSRPKNHEERDYLGMSGIAGCPYQQYLRLVDPPKPNDRMRWYAWTGYTHEAAIIELIEGAGIEGAKQGEQDIIADFDDRFRGHIDYCVGRTVIDVKSVYYKKLVNVAYDGPPFENVAQMQMYMAHGNFANGILIYVARDVPHWEWEAMRYDKARFGAFHVVDVPRDQVLIDKLNTKAKMILDGVDQRVPPRCDCGRCWG